jgi:hypothetical protein
VFMARSSSMGAMVALGVWQANGRHDAAGRGDDVLEPPD